MTLQYEHWFSVNFLRISNNLSRYFIMFYSSSLSFGPTEYRVGSFHRRVSPGVAHRTAVSRVRNGSRTWCESVLKFVASKERWGGNRWEWGRANAVVDWWGEKIGYWIAHTRLRSAAAKIEAWNGTVEVLSECDWETAVTKYYWTSKRRKYWIKFRYSFSSSK